MEAPDSSRFAVPAVPRPTDTGQTLTPDPWREAGSQEKSGRRKSIFPFPSGLGTLQSAEFSIALAQHSPGAWVVKGGRARPSRALPVRGDSQTSSAQCLVARCRPVL